MLFRHASRPGTLNASLRGSASGTSWRVGDRAGEPRRNPALGRQGRHPQHERSDAEHVPSRRCVAPSGPRGKGALLALERLRFGAASWLTSQGWVTRSRAMDIELDNLLALPHEERLALLRRLLAGDEVGRTVVVAAMLFRRSRTLGPAEQGL